jgi:hypothetical protein
VRETDGDGRQQVRESLTCQCPSWCGGGGLAAIALTVSPSSHDCSSTDCECECDDDDDESCDDECDECELSWSESCLNCFVADSADLSAA